MVNIKKLKGKIVEKGIKVSVLAKNIGIDTSTLYRKFKNNGETISIKEADIIVKSLNLTPEEAISIFFDKSVA